ncbi:hypothetical protein KAFR_0D00630 [Kazachstania africana CBS 2517]|uniref:Endonuclease/exonuclease/phosphatase domain-containing protein n=1 Tax=Kazachstania africana (strain ATCC 22294 / BCRC 22015 / CBS 2517 / CECT 1963 / NBRC 1671 / NRRL Y-8276) TaxID=1071382 RepID=H2ATL0_KAZAF|nr:hypothetical protein KAFR_0D00630 [Kazachstania africana CBS 2517]CCF57710.1 hypothetical protein KAFR_0D00630 [Kazachstania africana CBS 2517]
MQEKLSYVKLLNTKPGSHHWHMSTISIDDDISLSLSRKQTHSQYPTIKFLTFNTWGLKFVSKHRKERLKAIADKLAGIRTGVPLPNLESLRDSPDLNTEDTYDVVVLQEIWCKDDWDYLVYRCKDVFPFYRIFYSGIISGPGLAILSKIPIDSTFLHKFPINGVPSAITRGDWFVGKSISVTILKALTEDTAPLAILNSHMHAPYALTGENAYYCHRSCQAWHFSKIANLYKKAGYAVVIVGDLNSRPGSLPHTFLTLETGLIDSWEQLNGKQDQGEISKMNPSDQLIFGCTTCDSTLNTWRSKKRPDEACRLDYALVDPAKLQTIEAGLRFTERIPNVGSFSDHFAYSCSLRFLPQDIGLNPVLRNKIYSNSDLNLTRDQLLEKFSTYEELKLTIASYTKVAKRRKLIRGAYFWIAIYLLITSITVTSFTSQRAGWSSVFWVIFAIIVSVFGTINGLISFLFGRSELRALMEIEHEVTDAERNLQSVLDMKRTSFILPQN